MNPAVSNALLARLSDFVAAQMGLNFPDGRWADLQRGLQAASREFGFAEAGACAEWLLSAPLTKRQIEILASVLTVGETYFFREKKSLEILAQQILPELIQARRGGEQRLRLWSAGCCTGEEPYSLAILLHRILPDLPHWNITLLATDINPRFLRKAAAGKFGQWSFRDAPAWLQADYFTRTGPGQWTIHPEIRRMVSFSHLNLAEDAYPSLLNDTNAMDVILCRNVMMYFTPAQAAKVIQNFHHCLVEGGWLLVSPSEASHVLFPQYVAANFPEAILYRKDSAPARAIYPLKTEPDSFPPLNTGPDAAPEPDADTEFRAEDDEAVSPKAAEPSPAAPVSTPYSEARACYEQGRYAEATELLLRGHSGQGLPEPRALPLLARAFANQGKLKEAFDWCNRAIAADKLNPATHYLRATILQEQGAEEEAVRSLQRALYLDPDFVLAHFDLGNLAMRQGRLAEARRHGENALRLLRQRQPDELVPESEGITAGRLGELIEAQMESEALP